MLIVGIKYRRRYQLDMLWQENLRKKHCDHNVDICNNKKLNVCYIIKKKFAKNFYDSFILIKFGDLKPSLPLAM